MTISVIINDYEYGKRINSILEMTDFDIIKKVWEREDEILVSMQEFDFFKGRTRWSDLEPVHFRLMIMRNLTQAASMSNDERTDIQNPIIQSLHFLIGALIYCIQIRTDSAIELLRIHRFSEKEVNYDYSACMNIEIYNTPKPKEESPFEIIVDNDD